MGAQPRNGAAEAAPDSLLDARQAAAYLRLAPDTLYRWVQRGKLPVVRIGRTVRFRRSSLERFIADHEKGRGDEHAD